MNLFLKFFIPIFILLFLGAAFFWPSYRLYRRTGINPVVFGKKTNSAHDYIGNLYKLMFTVMITYGILNSFIEFHKLPYMDRTLFQVAGMILSLLALLFIMIAQQKMADSWRIGIDEEHKTELITTGPFAWVRNPVFAGMLLVLFSLFLMLPTSFMAYMMLLIYLIISIQVRLEEEYLTKVHGQIYLNYCSKVGRFLPKGLKK